MNIKYKYTKEELEIIVKQSVNMRHLLCLVGVRPVGGNYKTMQLRLRGWDISTEHWGTARQRQGHLKGKTHNWATKTPLSEILIENSIYKGPTHKLKLRLIKEGLFEKKCYNCNLTEWQKVTIPLELEHKNGDKFDNRIENLTLLCPNCHALTPTYRGKNKITSPRPLIKPEEIVLVPLSLSDIHTIYHCQVCNKILKSNASKCSECSHKIQRKVTWPTKEELIELVNTTSMVQIGKKFGVSDNSVRKWCKHYDIELK